MKIVTALNFEDGHVIEGKQIVIWIVLMNINFKFKQTSKSPTKKRTTLKTSDKKRSVQQSCQECCLGIM